jgi:hypothetical protein
MLLVAPLMFALGGAAKCEVMTTEPNKKTYKMMGKYSSEAAAKAAMATMKECGG